MKLAVLGTVYLGLVAGVCFAEASNYDFIVPKSMVPVTSLAAPTLFIQVSVKTHCLKSVKEMTKRKLSFGCLFSCFGE